MAVTEIADLDDPRVAPYRWTADPRRLEAEGLFIVEGRLVVPRLLARAAEPGWWAGTVQSVLLSPSAFGHLRPVVERHADVPTYVAPQALVDGLVGFNMHRGCLAVARRPPVAVLSGRVLDGRSRLVVLEGVNNPDNVGGIFRSAAALGADLVVLGPACADPLYRKCIRTSMGAALEVPFVSAPDWPTGLEWLRGQDVELLALTTTPGAVPLDEVRPRARVALLAGAEGPGLSQAALAHADQRVTIPMTGRVDSLNVATAVSIALYHLGVSART